MKRTNYTHATTNPYIAIAGLHSAMTSGLNAWIELQNNGEQDYPIVVPNPALDNPFNWNSSCSFPGRSEEKKFFNETEKDLHENWTTCFGTKEAVEDYQTKGIVSDALSKGMGVCTPIKKEDLLKIRPDLKGYEFWENLWTNNNEIQRWIPDPSIGKVYVVCTNDEPLDKEKSLAQLKEFVNSIQSL